MATTTTRHPVTDYDSFLDALGDRDRQNVERHVDFLYAELTGMHARLWKRLAVALARLAPRAVQTFGHRAVRFYVTDGIYRQQIFALEDLRDGQLAVYTGDALEAAIRAGLIRGPLAMRGTAEAYEVCGDPGSTLEVERLTTAKTADAPEYYKHMLGWNRTALRITFPVDASSTLVETVEAICALSRAPHLAPGPAVLSQ